MLDVGLKSSDIVVGRDTHLADKIVFVDGLSGTGKTMMGPILSSFKRVEVQRIEHIYQYVCSLNYLGRLSNDGAETLIKMYLDLACYNVMLGRESNFRWKDVSGVLRNPGGLRYLSRLFQPDGDPVIDRIASEQPIIHIASQQILGCGGPLFSALGDRLRLVEMVRNPVFLLQHWHSVMDRFGSDPRNFTIWIQYKGRYLPWFAAGWEEKYLLSNDMDRVIYLIEWFTKLADAVMDHLDIEQKGRVLVIPFENFVVNPYPHLRDLEDFLSSSPKRILNKTLKKEKIPRKITTDGRDLEIYRRYTWHPLDRQTSEFDEFKKRWDYAETKATSEGLAVLDHMSKAYNERYLD